MRSWEYPIVGHICRLEVQLSLIEWEPNEPSRCASAVRPSQCETLLIDTKDFFVSHSWSHPFADSVAALQRELILTKAGVSMAWIVSNNSQHKSINAIDQLTSQCIPYAIHSMYAIYAYIDPPNHPN